MRSWLAGVLLATVAAMVPAQATAANQETAERIAVALKESGQLHNYRIAVLSQNGTVWLKGRVATQDQMNTALQVAFEVPGVGRVVNLLTVGSGDASPSVPESLPGRNPKPAAERGTPPQRGRKRADALPEPLPVSLQPERIPQSQAFSPNPAQTTTSSRLPWAPDIVVSGPLTPTPDDPASARQPAWTKPSRTQAENAGEVQDARPFFNWGRRLPPKSASEQRE